MTNSKHSTQNQNTDPRESNYIIHTQRKSYIDHDNNNNHRNERAAVVVVKQWRKKLYAKIDILAFQTDIICECIIVRINNSHGMQIMFSLWFSLLCMCANVVFKPKIIFSGDLSVSVRTSLKPAICIYKHCTLYACVCEIFNNNNQSIVAKNIGYGVVTDQAKKKNIRKRRMWKWYVCVNDAK